MKQMVKTAQTYTPEQQAHDQLLITSLEARVQLLLYENSQLKE